MEWTTPLIGAKEGEGLLLYCCYHEAKKCCAFMQFLRVPVNPVGDISPIYAITNAK